MSSKKILGICYLPLPLNEGILNSDIIEDVLDALKPISYMPKEVRKKLLKIIPQKMKKNIPILKQFPKKDEEEVNNLFDMLKADLTIVNDFKEFYKKEAAQ